MPPSLLPCFHTPDIVVRVGMALAGFLAPGAAVVPALMVMARSMS